MQKQRFLEDNILFLSRPTLDRLKIADDVGDAIALYVFYYDVAKWQDTIQIKATTSYVAKGLKWSQARVRKSKEVLIKLGLIEDITTKDAISGLLVGWYIKINYYLWNNHPHEIVSMDEKSTLTNIHPVENHKTNALIDININALKDIIKSEYLLISNLLKDEIQKNDPKANITEANIKNWTNDVRLMVERDKRTLPEIREVLLWSQDNYFWRTNILSMGTLREKFTRLLLQMKPANKNKLANRERGLTYDVRKKPANI